MVFKRTTNGLSNQRLFYGTTYVVYVEGGLSYSKTDVYAGSYNNDSIDIIFWGKVFKEFNSTDTFKFKAIGSKATILDIATDILSGKVKSTYVAMDSEFDEIMSQKIIHNKILYTYGYSWENDV